MTLVLPQHVRLAIKSAAQLADEEVPIGNVMKDAVSFLFGEIDESDLKAKAREHQVQYPTYQEAVDALSWVICESVRSKFTVDNFREFIAEMDFLNTPDVLSVYQQAVTRVKETLIQVSPSTEHFVSADWRIQVEVARRSLRSIRRAHCIVNLQTTKRNTTVELTPQGLLELYQTLDSALTSCRTAKFRRIQRFVK